VHDWDRIALGVLLPLAHQGGALGAQAPQTALDDLFEDAH